MLRLVRRIKACAGRQCALGAALRRTRSLDGPGIRGSSFASHSRASLSQTSESRIFALASSTLEKILMEKLEKILMVLIENFTDLYQILM